ncbi:MAG: hypothetical protein ABIQ88_03545 [Chitinophagaceae bacterium]
MAEKEQKIPAVKQLTKKQVKKEVFKKLSGALAEYKSKLDKKTFESNLKKTSKLFAADISKAFKKDKKAGSVKKLISK